MDIETRLKAILGDRLRRDEPLSRHTNFRIGGPADIFAQVETRDEAEAVIAALVASETPYFVLGGGSNVLVADAGYRGTVVAMALRKLDIQGETVVAEAGVPTALLARSTVEAGLEGLEWAIGLPGTIGGAVRGNAGCFGSEMKDSVVEAEVLVIKEGERTVSRERWDAGQCGFGYRDSAFKRVRPASVILAVTFKLKPGDIEANKKKMEDILAKRREKQPLGAPSAGCTFKNVDFKDEAEIVRIVQDTDVPKEFLERHRIPSGWLVEQAGLKDFAIGDARVSGAHGNFIINAGAATADQVVQVIAAVKSRVRDKYGVQLEEEIQYVGF